jgi:LacI family transcriptional regulator
LNQKEIAKLAGVSSATISRVTNNDPGVSVETADRVRKIIAKYGYVQNAIARSLKTANTKTIGFLIPDISNPIFPAVLTGIEALCVKNGYNLILQNTSENSGREAIALETLLKHRVDGLIAIIVDREGNQLERFSAMGIPVALIDRLPRSGEYDSVTIDNIGGVTQGVDYLVRLGHTKIAIIHGPTKISPCGEERLTGYLSAMNNAGLNIVKEYIVDGNSTEEGGFLCAKELMQLAKPPTAIFSVNNCMTMGSYKALAEARVKIPKEVSLLGFDDFSLAAYLSPPITLINRPTAEMGKIAMEMLLERLTQKANAPARKVVLPTNLTVRSSCTHPQA